ncbi:MAG: TonB-dependent receptor [Gemmatimonadaceae bacterium]|nr:TonB-dependent receptor [Gemmatimonadaceae bacterium]
MRSFLALLLLPAALAAQPRTGTIDGRVIHAVTGQPLPNALVNVVGTERGARTGEDGRFRVTEVPLGIRQIQARLIGYTPLVLADVPVSTARGTDVTIRLNPSALDLAAVRVDASYFRTAIDAPASTQSFGAEETRRAPGVQEDVIRAVALLPGVAVTTAGRNDLAVRGGAPFQNLFVVDGIEVPNINHFGSQGSTGGPLSLLNIQFVDETNFSAGGFAAKYGDRTNSVTDLTLREGSRTQRGELNLSATGYGAFYEGPLGTNGSFLLGARRSYLDLLFQAAGFGFVPAYTDFTVKAMRRLDARNTLSFLTIGAAGDVSFNDETADNRYENSRVAANNQRQYFSGLRWKHLIDRGVLDVTVGRTYTRYRTLQRDSLSPPTTIFRANTTEGENALRADLTLALRPSVELNVGNQLKAASRLRFDLLVPGFARRDAAGTPRPLTLDTTFTALRNGTYAQVAWKPMPRVRLTAGGRVDWYGFLDNAVRVAPRVGARVGVTEKTTLTFASGRYWQPPQFIWLVGDATNRALRPFRSDHVIVGLEHLPRTDVKLQVEGYYQRHGGMPARVFRPQAVLAPSGFDDVTNDIPFGLEPLRNAAVGRSYGIEALAQKRLSTVPFYALATVSLNRTEFTSLEGRARPGAFETRWIANLLGGWRPNARWEVGAKVRAAAGLPTTPFITSGARAGSLDFSRYNEGERLPTFFALDARVDRRWNIGSRQLIGYIDVQNLTGRQNRSSIQWDPREQRAVLDESLGLLPSIGVNWRF